MKRTTILLATFLLNGWLLSQAQTSPSVRDIRIDVAYLSSDLLEGRATGSEGANMAAEYIAQRFEELGLQPKGDNGGWYQAYAFKKPVNPHDKEGSGKEVQAKNVVGFLDNQAPYTVVIGAHYDHLGWGGDGSRHAGDSAIHNGADDNASGTAGLMVLAAMLKSSKARHNNYLFIAFSGEEMGLFGSKAYAKNPTIDSTTINYMLNMDMIGRYNQGNLLAINGIGTSPAWSVLNDIKNDDISRIKTTESGVGPSDHTSFYLKGIPVLHFFTGQHRDYHKPSDDSHLINYQGIRSVCGYMADVIEAVDEKGKLAYVKTKDEDQEKAARFKVTLGVMPDYVFDGEGMRIDAVIDGGAASKGGLKDGDVVIGIGEHEVKEIYSYMEALSKFEKGNSTTVKVNRGGEVIEKKITF